MAQLTSEKLPEIVLTDDDDALRELLAEGLRSLGVSILECRDGQELKELLASAVSSGSLPALVISDQRMPRLTGLEVLAWMRRCQIEIPFALMSAFAADQLQESGLRHGATRVFDKPVDLREIRDFVSETLARSAKSEASEEESQQTA